MSAILEAKIQWLLDRCQNYYRDFKPIDEEEIRNFVREKSLDEKGIEDVWYGLSVVYEHKTMPSTHYFHKAYEHMFGKRYNKGESSKYDHIIRMNHETRVRWKTYDVKKVYRILAGILKKEPAQRTSTDTEFFTIYSDVYWESKFFEEIGSSKENIREHAEYILNAINEDEQYQTRRDRQREATPQQIEEASRAFENLNKKNPR